MHETGELIKAIAELINALAWPCVGVYFLVRFHRQIASLLGEMPSLVRRMRSAHGFGAGIELADKIEDELPSAQQQARSLPLLMPPTPPRNKIGEGE